MNSKVESIHKLIKIIDIISAGSTICSFIISGSITISLILLIFTLLLTCLSKFLENEEKIILAFRSNFMISSDKKSANRYFIIISLLYIVFIVFGLLLGEINPSMLLFFLLMIIMPICYSLLTLQVFLFDDHPSNIYGIFQFLIAPIPYYLIALMILIEHNGFWFELGTIIVSVILYIPVGAVSEYVAQKLGNHIF